MGGFLCERRKEQKREIRYTRKTGKYMGFEITSPFFSGAYHFEGEYKKKKIVM